MLTVIMTLSYLDFDRSEDTLGTVTFVAMASVRLDALSTVREELVAVLAWAQATFPGMQGPVEEGAVWDFDRSEQDDDGRVLLTLTLSGNADFAEAFERRFGAG